MAECTNCKRLQAQLDAAQGILEHNMALANRTSRHAMNERNKIIHNMRKRYSAVEIAEQVGLTRQRIHQILNEASDSAGAATDG